MDPLGALIHFLKFDVAPVGSVVTFDTTALPTLLVIDATTDKHRQDVEKAVM